MLGIRNTDEVKTLKGVSSFCVVLNVVKYGKKDGFRGMLGVVIYIDTKILVT